MTPPAVTGLNGFGLIVPDLDEAERFYTAFGLESHRLADTVLLRSPGRANTEIVLSVGPVKRLHHLSFAIDSADIDTFRDHLASRGFELHDMPPAGGHRDGLWLRDPAGTWINLAPGALAPVPEVKQVPVNHPGGRARIDVAAWLELDGGRGPLKLGHLLVFTPDIAEAEAFFCDALGMRVTDRALGKVSFLAAGTGVIDHHCFGLIASTHRGFQHASFQVGGFDDVGFGAQRMRQAGYGDGFGPGRHALASNIFHYVRDPWGSWVEYYADMDKVSDDWTSRDWNNLPYIWGPAWSPEFWGGQMNANLEPR